LSVAVVFRRSSLLLLLLGGRHDVQKPAEQLQKRSDVVFVVHCRPSSSPRTPSHSPAFF
jgi:hypothetical protein